MSIGMILVSITMSGKSRLLLLRSTGEMWPISLPDIQFVMPASLIKPSIAEACWSPALLAQWASGEEPDESQIEAAEVMQEARRKAVMILRKISRETEKMCGRLMSGVLGKGRAGGMDAVWEKWAPPDENQRTSITAVSAAEYLLNADNTTKPVDVKPNTLPAYAAHVLMMQRPDLFLGDQVDMWETGQFFVRSRAECRLVADVTRLANADTVENKVVLTTFLDKARAAIAESKQAREANSDQGLREWKQNLPQWTPEEQSIISLILLRLFEVRSTQESIIQPLATNIMKSLNAYPYESVLDRDFVPRLMVDLGVVPLWETLKRSELRENETRSMAGIIQKGQGELLQGNELDQLRQDFTGQRVFVIDDPSATELDDGIAIERVPGSDDAWIHAHVADPTRFLPLNHPLSVQASFRGASAYMPEGNVQLLPHEITMKELSLGAEVSRDGGAQGVMTFSTKLSPSGEMLDSKVQMGWIKKPHVVSYDAVNVALNVQVSPATKPFGTPAVQSDRPYSKQDIPSDALSDLLLLQSFAAAFRLRRFANAGLDFSYPSASINVLDRLPPSPDNYFDRSQIPSRPAIYSGSPIIDYTVSHQNTAGSSLSSMSIVAELMIMANRTAATFCSSRSIAGPFRISGAPRAIALPGQSTIPLETLLAERDPHTMLIDSYKLAAANRTFDPTKVSTTAGPQWLMGFDDSIGYVRATSPLRRFDDMLVHWQIKSALAADKGLSSTLAPAISSEDMGVLIKRSMLAERRTRKAGMFAKAWWTCGLFSSRMADPRPLGYNYDPSQYLDIREPTAGVIVGPTVYGTTSIMNTTPIFLPALGTLARMPGKGKSEYTLGQEVRVKITSADQWPVPIIDTAVVE